MCIYQLVVGRMNCMVDDWPGGAFGEFKQRHHIPPVQVIGDANGLNSCKLHRGALCFDAQIGRPYYSMPQFDHVLLVASRWHWSHFYVIDLLHGLKQFVLEGYIGMHVVGRPEL